MKHETYIYEVTRERNRKVTESGGNINVAKSKQKRSPSGNIRSIQKREYRIRVGSRMVLGSLDPNNGPTLSRLLQNLAPLVKEPSSSFDSKATAICASLGLDPNMSEEIVSLFKKQFVANGCQESRYVGVSPPVPFNR